MTDYLAWIDEQLAYHEREVAKLAIAREVLLEADGNLQKSYRPERGGTGRRSATTEAVLAALSRFAEPATAGEILTAIAYDGHVVPPKTVYSSLYNAVKSGKVAKDGKKFSIQRRDA